MRQTKLNSGNFEYQSSFDVDKNHFQLGLYWALWLVFDCTNFDARSRFRLNDITCNSIIINSVWYPSICELGLLGEKKKNKKK